MNGHQSGTVVESQEPRKVRPRTPTRSILPLIIVGINTNGEPVGQMTIVVQNNAPVADTIPEV